MPGNFKAQVEGYTYYDPSGNEYGLVKYTCVSLATAAEVAAANAAGVQGNKSEICVPTPVAGGLPTRRVLGITQGSVLHGDEVLVTVSGVTWALAGAAIAEDAIVFAAVSETRTNKQTPLVDVEELLIPVDPRLTISSNLVMLDDTALPGANTLHWPVGYALKPAAAKYDIIPIELDLGYRR